MNSLLSVTAGAAEPAKMIVAEFNNGPKSQKPIAVVGKGITFDTGGTILDWHIGFRRAFEKAGKEHKIDRDWANITNELRRKSLNALKQSKVS